MPNQPVILYTYALAAGSQECHAYGPTSQTAAQAEGEKLKAAFDANPADSFSEFTFMVLPLEAMPS